ncbi:copper homeostasis protein CutC [Corynebacterium uterequi]|uniref:Copper homeostasis protein cutC homolog n=1 Tax=Corynebacterium uterequi TaxID=1072256 RepID=A0A0G3HEJ2_9CORY|nr:copper homeostasis protein CutC [Corynebacterium uterequi]AKK11120.1 CutC family protein [Corynebacterium uterequi]
MPLLEVIALSAADARAARDGGADRVEVVGTMDSDGLSPSPHMVAAAVATGIPVRAMLRLRAGFATDAAEITRLKSLQRAYLDAGAQGVVLGFLDASGRLDIPVLSDVLAGAGAYTLHRAIDHAVDYRQAFEQLTDLPSGLTHVLTAGSPAGVTQGMDALRSVLGSVPGAAELMMVGGGLRPEHLAPLTAAGVQAFHLGSPARDNASFTQPVNPALVARWRELLDAS